MNKVYPLLLLSVFALASCGGDNPASSSSSAESESSISESSSEDTRSYHIVTFHLNSPKGDDAVVSSQIVKKDQGVAEAVSPTIEGYLFKGWCLDKEGQSPYTFGATISEDLDLYASWKDMEEATDIEKVKFLYEKIQAAEGKVIAVEESTDITQVYYFASQEFGGTIERDYKRYEGITTLDYYTTAHGVHLATQQFYYDENNFYNIFDIFEETQDSTDYKKVTPYKASKEESFLNIGVTNLYLQTLAKCYSIFGDGDAPEEYGMQFGDTDFEKFDWSGSGSFSFQLAYEYDVYNEQYETTLQTLYAVQAKLYFLRGQIYYAEITDSTVVAVDGELYAQYIYESEATFHTDYEYPTFTGKKLDPALFPDYVEE